MSIEKEGKEEKTPKSKVVNRFNYLLRQRKFYNRELFHETDLPSFTFDTLQAPTSKFKIMLGNRLLLENVFPPDIIRIFLPFRETIRIDKFDNPDKLLPHSKDGLDAAAKEFLDVFVNEEIDNENDPIRKEILRLKLKEHKTISHISERLNVSRHLVRRVFNESKIRLKERLENIGVR